MGGAHGGHYKALIRDEYNEKIWDPAPLKEAPPQFPYPPSDPSLLNNWFEFNDTSVKPI